MTDSEKLDVIREILDWECEDDAKRFYIYSFISGFQSAERIRTIALRFTKQSTPEA